MHCMHLGRQSTFGNFFGNFNVAFNFSPRAPYRFHSSSHYSHF